MPRNTAAPQSSIETTDLVGGDHNAELPRQDQAAPLVEVRALIDDPRLSLVAGQLGRVPASEVDALQSAGVCDAHADAVAFARSLSA